jgi:hypothetical protein
VARTKQEVADAWGRLAGLAVTACHACHAAHCICDDETDDHKRHRKPKKAAKKTTTTGRKTRNAPDGEIDAVTLTVSQRCPDSWTGTMGEVVVNYDAPAVTVLARPDMHLLPADGVMAAASYAATAPVDAPQGVSDITVSLVPLLPMPRGLYIGRLRPANGGNPNNPVLIYIDDVI